MVYVPGDALNLAAAVDPNLVRQRGPAEAVRTILLEAGVRPPANLETAEWRGTGLLTRHSPRISARRLLVLGDAAGYVEPFTGEGMTWGMLSRCAGSAVGRGLAEPGFGAERRSAFAARHDFARLARAWSALYRTHIAPRQRHCRILSSFLRRPTAVRAAMALMAVAPNVAKPLIGHFWNSGQGVEVETKTLFTDGANAALSFAATARERPSN